MSKYFFNLSKLLLTFSFFVSQSHLSASCYTAVADAMRLTAPKTNYIFTAMNNSASIPIDANQLSLIVYVFPPTADKPTLLEEVSTNAVARFSSYINMASTPFNAKLIESANNNFALFWIELVRYTENPTIAFDSSLTEKLAGSIAVVLDSAIHFPHLCQINALKQSFTIDLSDFLALYGDNIALLSGSNPLAEWSTILANFQNYSEPWSVIVNYSAQLLKGTAQPGCIGLTGPTGPTPP